MLKINEFILILVILHDISLKNFCASPSRFGFIIYGAFERSSVWLSVFLFPSGLAPSGLSCFAFQQPVLFGTAKVEDIIDSPKLFFSFLKNRSKRPISLFPILKTTPSLRKRSAKIGKEALQSKSVQHIFEHCWWVWPEQSDNHSINLMMRGFRQAAPWGSL
jgi:hypothetical protein